MTTLPRVSASKLKMYQACPKQYAYRYIQGKGELNIWGILGSAAHKAIELYYKEQKPIVQTFFERANASVHANVEGFENALSIMQTIQEGLEKFDPSLYVPVDLEKYFRLPYPDAENPICTIEGYMDLTTATSVVDFKTGKDLPSKLAVQRDLQFVIYHWAYEQIYGKAPESIVYHRLRGNKQIIGTQFDRAELHALIETFLADPMQYDTIPCEKCPFYCGVRRAINTIST